MFEQRYTRYWAAGLHRVNLVAHTSANSSWVDSLPAPKPNADKVRYIGHGTGSASVVNLFFVAHDIRLRTHNVVDGHCPHDRGFCRTELLQLRKRGRVMRLYAGRHRARQRVLHVDPAGDCEDASQHGVSK